MIRFPGCCSSPIGLPVGVFSVDSIGEGFMTDADADAGAGLSGLLMTLLFGSIAVIGMNTLVRAGQSLTAPRNLVVVSLILVFGIGGMQFGGAGQFTLQGVSLAALVGILLNAVLPGADENE
jgi:hypothetical protein